VFTGVPAGFEVKVDALDVAFQGADGRSWESGLMAIGTFVRPSIDGFNCGFPWMHHSSAKSVINR
jgi:hypothetical protein